MKNRVVYATFWISIVLLIAIFSFYLFPISASAESNIIKLILNRSSGSVGTSITVSGENFAGTQANIYWDNKVVTKEVPISNGKFNYTLTIPAAYKGNHTISADDNSNWAGSKAETVFNVSPSISIFPNIAEMLTPLLLQGNGFDKNESNIKIMVDGKIISGQPINADRNGYWSTNYVAQDIKKGRHIISAYGSLTKDNDVGNASFILAPWLEVEPKSGTVGTQLIIKGWGFMHNEDGITVTWDKEIIKVNIRAEIDGSLVIDGSKREYGTFTSGNDYRETVYVPRTPQGTHEIGVYGSSFTPKGTLPNYSFLVTPKVIIQPSSGHKGNRIEIEGTGFAKNELVKLTYGNIEINTDITAGDTGSFYTEYIIPQSSGKEHIISAKGNKGNSSEAKFIIDQIDLLTPKLVSPTNETTISIFGSVGDVYIGSIRYFAGISDYLRGIVAKTNEKTIAIFKWETGDNNQDISYVLQVSSNKDFKTIILDKSVASNEYTLTRNDSLAEGNYFWRVKSVNETGSESSWSEVSSLNIISTPSRVFIFSSIVLVLIIAAIIFALISIWVYMVNKYKY